MNLSTKTDLKFGHKYPYDGNRPQSDWAHRAARGIIANLEGRRGIKNELNGIDKEIKVEIIDEIAEIIRVAEAESLR